MNTKILSFIFLLFFAFSKSHAQSICPILPQPQNVEKLTGFFELSKNTQLIGDDKNAAIVSFFIKELKGKTGITINSNNKSNHQISLKRLPLIAKGGYQLLINLDKIEIKASDNDGFFNGLVSLMQLIDFSSINNKKVNIECWSIKDEPRYAWRGLMLDEARHFFGVKKVKQILDWMAFYKLNRFHWHLTDAQGWRLAINKYPKLATIGGKGNFTDSLKEPNFYTQSQIQEIVKYAIERNITVIPEIDMPGHATASNRAYPEYNGGGSEQYPNFTFNPGKEKTYNYLTDIIKETISLFPSKMIHLGGDEVSFGAKAWETNADVKQLMLEHDLKDIQTVENYFFRRMADTVTKLNHKVLAWDEAVDANLSTKNTLLFWWRHDKPEQLDNALTKGYNVVLCPRLPLYFDFVQAENHQLGRKWQTKFNKILDVYQFPGTDKKYNNDLILGIQANVWTETIYDENRLDFMLFPRIAALAAAAWNKQDDKESSVFLKILEKHQELYKKAGINFYNALTDNTEK